MLEEVFAESCLPVVQSYHDMCLKGLTFKPCNSTPNSVHQLVERDPTVGMEIVQCIDPAKGISRETGGENI